MTKRRLAASAATLVLLAAAAASALSSEIDRLLRESQYVYLQSERKSGELGKPSEIWFYYDGKAVYVGTRPTSWRVRRIKASRPKARIAVGKMDGPSFRAKGEIVHDAAVEEKMMAEYARKYPDGWPRHADGFRQGFKSGDRVLVRYTPVA